MQQHVTPQSAPPWDLVDLSAALGPADIARLAADVDDAELVPAVGRASVPGAGRRVTKSRPRSTVDE